MGYWKFDDGGETVEDFTAASDNIENLPDWFFSWVHAASPDGGAVLLDENYVMPDPNDDEDTLPKWWEEATGLNATKATADGIDGSVGIHGPSGDLDGDGLTNLQEYLGVDGVGQINDGAPGAGIQYRFTYFADQPVFGKPVDMQLAQGFTRTLGYDANGNVWLEISGVQGFDGDDIPVVVAAAGYAVAAVNANLEDVLYADLGDDDLIFDQVGAADRLGQTAEELLGQVHEVDERGVFELRI